MKNKQPWFDSSIIKEDESKTTENAKHFILNNGTRKAVFHPKNINYFDKSENVWKPIDNSLKATENGYLSALGKYTAKISKTSENETVEISNETDRISWEYLGANKSIFSAPRNVNASTKRKSKLSVTKSSKDSMNLSHASRAVYKNAEGNIDLDYLLEGNGIKENIVIKEKSDSYHYYFLLRVAGFEMERSPDGAEIKFYKPACDSDTPEERIPEFIMPAPFMYDANGKRSDNVTYKLECVEEGVYLFSVEADATWINATERVFPVCIDPQLLSVSGAPNITVTHDRYSWYDPGSCCETAPYWKHVDSPYYSYIYLHNDETNKTTATLHINKANIDLTRNELISAKLIFEQRSNQNNSSAVFLKIGSTNYMHYNQDTITVNITNLYGSHSEDFDIDLSLSTVGHSREFCIPTLEIEYQPISSKPVRKTFSIGNGVDAELDIVSGNSTVTFEDISDPVLGVSVSHVYKPDDTIVEYGKNFRLNLDEKLVNTSTSTDPKYIYTDPLGDVHTFEEHFYKIGANGEKEYIESEISSITAEADGRLWLNDFEVFRELTTVKGLRASARLEGVVNNAEWIEQRMDEEKQLDEQIKAYKNTLCNFVSINKETGGVTSDVTDDLLSSPDSVEIFLSSVQPSTHLLLSKEEAVSYKSLLTQRESLTKSQESLELQKESLKNNAESLLLQYNAPQSFTHQQDSIDIQQEALAYEKKGLEYAKADYKATCEKNKIDEDQNRIQFYNNQIALIGLDSNANGTKAKLLEENSSLIEVQEDNWVLQKEQLKSQIGNFPKIGAPADTDGTLTKQYKNVDAQSDLIDKQIEDIDAQIELYSNKSEKYISQFRSYYKEYINLKNQLDALNAQLPVRYLISDSVVKGFNADGALVVIQDKYGKYVVVERAKYTTSETTRVSAVYDQDNRVMRFSYNGNNLLSEICNSLGEKVTFRYDASNRLTAVEYSDRPGFTLSYTKIVDVPKISKVAFTNNTSVALSYNHMGMLARIAHTTTVNTIAHNDILLGSNSTLSEVVVAYNLGETKLTYDGIKQEIYKIYPLSEKVHAYYELINNVVTSAEFYSYFNHLLSTTERAGGSCLNRYSYEEFQAELQIESVEDVTYNSFKEPIQAVTSKYALTPTNENCCVEETIENYTYNDNRKLIEKRTIHSHLDCCEAYDTTIAREKYYYNNAGELVRKESYIEGEELKTGITVEEHVFNDKGVEIQSFTYNSLDPSSKFYTENEVDENGKVLCVWDESGEHKTAFDYEPDGVTVKTERLPNGSKLSYGSTKDGSVTAITHSTEEGEENCTTQTRTLGVVTEVKSGNNTVRYEYDDKRRVKSVSLNGVDNYVTYTYSGEHTDAEQVIATTKTGIEATTTKNAHGNVTNIVCGDHTVENEYNADQQLTKNVDSISGETTLTYDAKGNVETVTAPDRTEAFAYNEPDNTLDSKTIMVNGVTHTYEYSYKPTADKALDSISVDGNTVRPQTDALGRSTGKTIEAGNRKIAEEKISYVKFGDHATSLPSNVRFATNGVFNKSIQYKYDSMGNIIEIFENGRSACRYEYDALGRLTREDNVAFGKTTTWSYDNNGNIIARYEYAITAKPTSELHLLDCVTKLYAYQDNSDQLMSYDGTAFVYDTIGNPTTYRGKTATWAYGRQLMSFDGNTFEYDARGRRTAKNGITFTYDSNGNLIKQSNGLEFLYDHSGVFALKYNGSTYFYRKDAQANIVALLDSNGSVVV
ncbi:MAG: hypothetical protein IKB41_01805, partial [Clostridia bacterium]|nr:hypothetical protein [Clostridia bacterium]